MTRTCSDCPSPISRYSKGRCRPCAFAAMQADPVATANRKAAVAEAVSRPESRAKLSDAQKRVNEQRRNDPEWRAMKRNCGEKLQDLFRHSPEALAKWRQARLQMPKWCPPDLQDEYRALRRKVGRDEARRIVEAQIPGTVEHARRMVASNALNMQLKHERELGSRY